MDYKAFYAEISEWILQVNNMAIKHGLDSDVFWKWVMDSSAVICEKYKNNKLVLNQMVMLYLWLDDVYKGTVTTQ